MLGEILNWCLMLAVVGVDARKDDVETTLNWEEAECTPYNKKTIKKGKHINTNNSLLPPAHNWVCARKTLETRTRR